MSSGVTVKGNKWSGQTIKRVQFPPSQSGILFNKGEGMNKLQSLSAAVIEVLDRYPVGYRFHGNELKNDVVRLYPESKDSYVDTFLRMARRHRRGFFRVVNRNNSLYEKV